MARFAREFEQKNGIDARVRIVSSWIFEARDRKGMSYPELAVLAAIYSKIGATKDPVQITREEIWRRAQGFKSERVFKTEHQRCQPFTTKRQVRSIIDRLHDRKCFARVTYARRQTYYSHRLSAEQLSDRVFSRKMRPDLARRARIHANNSLTERIQAERRRLASPYAGAAAADPPLK